MNEKQLVEDKPNQTLKDLLNLCAENNIDKPTLLNVISLYNRLTLDMQARADVVKAESPLSVVLVKRSPQIIHPITMI